MFKYSAQIVKGTCICIQFTQSECTIIVPLFKYDHTCISNLLTALCYSKACLHTSTPCIILNVTAHIFNTINIDETTLKIISHFAVSIKPSLQFAPSHVHLHPDNVLIFSTVRTESLEITCLFHGQFPTENKRETQ